MTGRRSTTATPPTPIEETEPTAPAPEPAPPAEPVPAEPAPEPDSDEAPPTGLAGLRRWMENPLGLPVAAAAKEGEYPLTVGEAIAEVTRRVEHISKDRTASQGGSYRYRGIDDVLSALHPILGDVGLVIMPGRMVEHRRETRATSSGGTLNVALVRVRYRLIGPDGTTTTGEAWGEGGDSGDKATQKALSQAYKSFTLQLFSIPTEDSSRDEPDATNPPSRPFSAEEVSRAATALAAARDAATLPDLVGVRRRAVALLDVPTHGPDNTLAPLSWHFDQRRAELERAQP